MVKQVVVFGAGGMLGRAVTELFRRKGLGVRAITRAEYDIARDPLERLEPLLDGDAILNCAGVIKPRIAGTPVPDVLRVNGAFPLNLASLCVRRSIPCLHVTTDCVYSGRKGGYDERALIDADDVYGLSKAAGDRAECMVLRTSIIGEEHGEGRSLLEWARTQRGKEVNGFTNHRWNGLTTVALADAMWRILTEQRHRPGIVHLFSPHVVTKAELLEEISVAYGLGLRVRPGPAAEPCDRSLSSIHPLSREICRDSIPAQLQQMRRFFTPEA
jgi:dTDP-4-dehydrorhamnose reductase